MFHLFIMGRKLVDLSRYFARFEGARCKTVWTVVMFDESNNIFVCVCKGCVCRILSIEEAELSCMDINKKVKGSLTQKSINANR